MLFFLPLVDIYRHPLLRSLFLKTPLSPSLVVYGTVKYDRNDGDARALPFQNLTYESEPENCVIEKKLSLFLEFTATFTCDDKMEMFADGQSLGTDSNWGNQLTIFQLPIIHSVCPPNFA